MVKSMSVRIGDVTFPSQAAAKWHAKTLLARYEKGQFISAEDIPFVEGLLERHPNRPSKVGVGVARFEAGSGKYNEKCFVVRQIDNSVAAFSYKKAIAAHPEI